MDDRWIYPEEICAEHSIHRDDDEKHQERVADWFSEILESQYLVLEYTYWSYLNPKPETLNRIHILAIRNSLQRLADWLNSVYAHNKTHTQTQTQQQTGKDGSRDCGH